MQGTHDVLLLLAAVCTCVFNNLYVARQLAVLAAALLPAAAAVCLCVVKVCICDVAFIVVVLLCSP